jgi:hypothetical protein
MNKRLIYLTFLLMIFCVKNSSQECLCSGRRIGEYCGTELNRINGNSDCDRNMYFCGTTNRNKTAVLLKSCPTGRECDVISRGSMRKEKIIQIFFLTFEKNLNFFLNPKETLV